MTETTPARLAELRAVAEAATQGPWESDCCVAANIVYDQHGLPIGVDATEDDAIHIATFDPPTVLALIAALEAKTAEVEAAERQLAIRAEDSIARRLAMATVAEVGTETAAGDTADTLAELLIEAERERDEAHNRKLAAERSMIRQLERAEKAEAALERVKALHHDAGESQGYTPEVRGGYGIIPHSCASCGSFGEYGMAWPCETIQALETGAKQ